MSSFKYQANYIDGLIYHLCRYVTWIDRDPETIARQEALQKKEKMAKDDNELMAEFINKQIERGNVNDGNDRAEFTDLLRTKDDKISLNLELKSTVKSDPITTSNILGNRSKNLSVKEETKKGTEKRKKSALEEIMEEEQLRKKQKEKTYGKAIDSPDHDGAVKRWLKKGIVVKIVTKSLGDKYFKQKGYVKEIVGDDKMAAVVVLISSGTKIKLDQSHLETVIPAVGRTVLILCGRYKGKEAILKTLDVDHFCAKLKVVDNGEKISLPYEDFSKLYES